MFVIVNLIIASRCFLMLTVTLAISHYVRRLIVDVVGNFVYLGVKIEKTGSEEPEIEKRSSWLTSMLRCTVVI